MKKVRLFILEHCPHCINAMRFIDELRKENQRYETIDITIVDEQKEKEYADGFDYYYVPTFYLDHQKEKEGIVSKEDVKNILDKALEDV